MSWRAHGRIAVEETRRPISGLIVEVWDKDVVTRDDFLGRATTDTNGLWSVEFEDAAFNDFGLDPEPDLYLRIRLPGADGRLVLSSEDFVRQNASRDEAFELTISCWSFVDADPMQFRRLRPALHGVVRLAGTRERLRGLDVALTSSKGEVYTRGLLKDGAYALWMDAAPAEANVRLALPGGSVLVDVPVLIDPDDLSPQDFEVGAELLDSLLPEVAAHIRPAVPIDTVPAPRRR